MRMVNRYLISIVFVAVFSLNGRSQINNIGIPPVINFSRHDYNMASQNWSATQDSEGVMYFANNWGVLEFDGVSWNKYRLKSGAIARSVLAGKNGEIWVGGANEFGYLFPKENGKLSYRSLSDSLGDTIEKFAGVWSIIETTEGTYFQSKKSVFLFNNSVKQIYKSNNLNRACLVDGRIYLNDEKKGLLIVDEDSVNLVKDGQFFRNKNVVAILPYDKELKVVVTALHGLYLLSNNGIINWENANSDLIKTSNIYTAIKYKDYFLLGSTSNGLIILDIEGNKVKNYTIQGGLQSNSVSAIYVDKDQNCWLGLQNGIDYIKLNSSVTNLVAPGRIGAGYTSCIFKQKFYFGTNQGVYTISENELFNTSIDYPEFKQVPSLIGQVWKLQVIGDNLFVGKHDGAYSISDKGLRKLSSIQGFWWFKKISDNPDVVISGTYDGFHIFKRSKNDGLWYYSHRLKSVDGSIRFAESLSDGTFWFSGGRQGVFRITFNNAYDSIIAKEKYTTDKGLPPEEFNYHLLSIDNDLYVSTSEGIFKYNREKNRFEYDKDHTNILGVNKIINHQFYGDYNMFFFQEQELRVLNTNLDGSKNLISFGLNELKNNYISSFENLLVIDNYHLFIGNQDGFVHFNPNILKGKPKDPNVLIREIWHGDSILYGGAYYDRDTNKILKSRPDFTFKLPFSKNSMHFKFATTDFNNVADNKFSYYLEGFDDDWGPFTNISEREYTYLLEGNYVFRVRAMNDFGVVSEEERISFTITPPLYRTKVAYLLYIILFTGIVFIVIVLFRRKYETEKKQAAERHMQELSKTQEEHEKQELKISQNLMQLANEKLQVENELNMAEIKSQSIELATFAMQLTYKNDLLSNVKQKLLTVSQSMLHEPSKEQVVKLAENIGSEIQQKDNWDKFEMNFDQVHEDFLKKLREKHTALTPKELKLAAYLRMNLSSKEIASLLNITPRSVEISRHRLRKKLNLERSVNLVDYLMRLS